MANEYGSERYYAFRKQWNRIDGDEDFVISDFRTYTYGKYKIKYDEYKSPAEHGEPKLKHTLTVYRNNDVCYECKDIYSGEGTFFYFFTYRGSDYLMFHKDDLYGYTLLDLDTLDEHNYFPSAVLDGGESFIVTEALLWNDVLLLFGCFWGGPFLCYLLDLNTFKTRRLCDTDVEDNGLKPNGDKLLVEYSDGTSQTFDYAELYQLLKSGDTIDL